MEKKMIIILGPTATGKTRLAALLADAIDGEIISADSRQVYRKMDIGTGKDKDDYVVEGRIIKNHLIDVADAGEQYSLFRYKTDFLQACRDIKERDKYAIICGGSGMYIETALGLYDLPEVKSDETLREQLKMKSDAELAATLINLTDVHNTTDLTDRERLIRAIEIALVKNDRAESQKPESVYYDNQPVTKFIYGVYLPREVIRDKITARLRKRLNEGLIQEVESLLKNGVTHDTLNYYGLEYKFISQYLQGKLTFNEMFNELNTAIHQFAKRQMTWFRRMEKRGIVIKWLPPDDLFVQKIVDDINAVSGNGR